MQNILGDIQKGVQSFFRSIGKQPSSVIGIDIGSSSLKVVQLKKDQGRVILETYGAVALGPYAEQKAGELPTLSTDQIAQAFADVCKEANITSLHAALSLQSQASLIFVLRLPASVKESQYNTVIPTEARKYIPIPLTEVSLDWWVIPEQEYTGQDTTSGTREVLVVAVRNTTLAEYRDIAKASHIDAGLFELEIFSIIRSSFSHELEPVLVVDFGARSTRVAIVEYGIVRVFHTVNRGSHALTQNLATSLSMDFSKAEELKHTEGLLASDPKVTQVINTSVGYIFSEINSVLLQYEREYHKSVGKMIIAGGGARMPGFLDKVRSEFQFPVEPSVPFEKTVYPEFLKQILSQVGPEFSIAVGLALKQIS